jgi:hypothetical protein
MGERRGVYRFWWGNLKERNHWGDPSVDGRIILRWIFRNAVPDNVHQLHVQQPFAYENPEAASAV